MVFELLTGNVLFDPKSLEERETWKKHPAYSMSLSAAEDQRQDLSDDEEMLEKEEDEVIRLEFLLKEKQRNANKNRFSYKGGGGSYNNNNNNSSQKEIEKILIERKAKQKSEREESKKNRDVKYDRDDDHLSLFVSILSPYKFYDNEKFERIKYRREELRRKGRDCLMPRPFISFSQACSMLFPSDFLGSGCWATDLFVFTPTARSNYLLELPMTYIPYVQQRSTRIAEPPEIITSINYHPTSETDRRPTALSNHQLSLLSYNYPLTPIAGVTLPPEKPHCFLRRGLPRLYNPIYDQLIRRTEDPAKVCVS
jgi:hypothetical protein